MMEGNGGGGDDAVDEIANGLNATAAGDDGEAGDDNDDDDDDGGVEYVGMSSNVYYLAPVLRMFALLHTFAAIAMMIGYYYLKVSSHTCTRARAFNGCAQGTVDKRQLRGHLLVAYMDL